MLILIVGCEKLPKCYEFSDSENDNAFMMDETKVTLFLDDGKTIISKMFCIVYPQHKGIVCNNRD